VLRVNLSFLSRRFLAFDFERWAVSLIGGLPNQKRTGDKGVDGVARFYLDKAERGRAAVCHFRARCGRGWGWFLILCSSVRARWSIRSAIVR
jgi:hypothetical protein